MSTHFSNSLSWFLKHRRSPSAEEGGRPADCVPPHSPEVHHVDSSSGSSSRNLQEDLRASCCLLQGVQEARPPAVGLLTVTPTEENRSPALLTITPTEENRSPALLTITSDGDLVASGAAGRRRVLRALGSSGALG